MGQKIGGYVVLGSLLLLVLGLATLDGEHPGDGSLIAAALGFLLLIVGLLVLLVATIVKKIHK